MDKINLNHKAVTKPVASGETRDIQHKGEKAVASGNTRREITSLDDLVDFFKIDLSEWEIERWTANQWQQGANVDGEIVITPLYQVKAWMRRKTAVVNAKHDINDLIADARTLIRAKPLPLPKPIKTNKTKDCLLEINISDLHLGKLCWDEETGERCYNLEIAVAMAKTAFNDLLASALAFPNSYEQIVFPIGNDFFHVDNTMHMTTGGTPQDMDGRWQKAYRAGRMLLVEMIQTLRRIAPVYVKVVPGNHDEQSMFTLGDSLDLFFADAEDVHIDNAPKLTKYFEYGQNLIGYNHGKDIKLSRLPSVMASEQKEAWGRTKFRFIRIGHFHGKGESIFAAAAEEFGVRVSVVESLTPSDAYHARKGYVGNLPGAQATVYHRDRGQRAQFSHIAEI